MPEEDRKEATDIEALRKEIEVLKEELAKIREKKNTLETSKERTASIGEAVNAFISSLMRDLAESITREISVVVAPKKIIVHKKPEVQISEAPANKAASLIAPLAHAERIRILQALQEGGKYATDLAQITELEAGPLHFHINSLVDAGYIMQERERGRYLITMPGRVALKLVEYLYDQLSKFGR